MSKVYNIIEAINMPVGTEFEVYLDGKENPDSKLANGNMIVNYDYEFVWAKNNERIDEMNRDMFNAKFYKIPQPVTFKEAFESNKKLRLNESYDFNEFNKYNDDSGLLGLYQEGKFLELDEVFFVLSKYFDGSQFKQVFLEKCWYIEE